MERGLPAAAFDELQIPFHCVATDAAEARERWFDEGRLVDAVLASAAMPALFPAVEIDGRRYIDGAVVSDVPVGRAADLGARTIYVLDVGRFPGGRPATRRPLDRLLEAYWITRFDRYRRALDALPHGVAVHLLPPGDPPRLRLHDFSRSADLIRSAYRASLAYLDDAGHPGVTAARNEASAMSSAADASARWVRRISASPP